MLLDRSPQCPVVVDTMKNQSSRLYAALPERLYVLQAGKILYKVVPRGKGPRAGEGGKGFVSGRSAFKLLPSHLPACDRGQVLSCLGVSLSSSAKWRFWPPTSREVK